MNLRSYINLLVKDAHTVFCFFQISEQSKNEYVSQYGLKFINEAIPFIKVFYLENGVTDFKYTLYPDKLANNWYLNIKDDDQDIYAVLGLIHDNTIIEVAKSNVVTTPREHPSMDMELYYAKIDLDGACGFTEISDNPIFTKISKGHYFPKNQAMEEKIHKIKNKKLSSSR